MRKVENYSGRSLAPHPLLLRFPSLPLGSRGKPITAPRLALPRRSPLPPPLLLADGPLTGGGTARSQPLRRRSSRKAAGGGAGAGPGSATSSLLRGPRPRGDKTLIKAVAVRERSVG